MHHLSNHITAALALDDPIEQGIQASQVGHSRLLQQQCKGRNLVAGGSTTSDLLQPACILTIFAPCNPRRYGFILTQETAKPSCVQRGAFSAGCRVQGAAC